MKRILLIFVIFTATLCFGLGRLEVESVESLDETNLQISKYDADGKFAPLLFVKTELKPILFQNVGRGNRNEPVWDEMNSRWKCYLNVGQNRIKIGSTGYDPIEINLRDYGVMSDEKRCYVLTLINHPEHEVISYSIISDPSDAEKWVDGVNLGTGQGFQLAVGTHELELRKSGHKTVKLTIEVNKSTPFVNVDKMTVQEPVAVTIDSKPDKAKIYLDNADKGETRRSMFLYPGAYRLKLLMPGYLDVDEEIEVVEGTKNEFSYTLTENAAYIVLNVEPTDAMVRINTKDYTGQKTVKLEPGEYAIEISKSGFLPYQTTKNLKIGDRETITATLTENAAYVDFAIEPQDATIMINKENYSGQKRVKLAPGSYLVELSKEGWHPQQQTVDLQLGDTVQIQKNLTQMTGTLQFTVVPDNAVIIMTREGEEIDRWTGLKYLKGIGVGKYEVKCKADGYITKKDTIKIEEDNVTVIEMILNEGSDLKFHTSPTGIEMTFVEGGSFQMGSDDGDNDEEPVHNVTVSSFYIGKHEVTQKQWQKVMRRNPSYFKGDDLPVEKVSWYDCIDFCNELSRKEGLMAVYTRNGDDVTMNIEANGYRLPTEAEWEYAARGGNRSNNFEYSGSNKLKDVGWYKGNSGSQTHEVGGKKANELGIHDMSGNVWEWCWDWFDGDYYQNSPSTDPTGPSYGSVRARRCGDWGSKALYCVVACRSCSPPSKRYNNYGFRVCRSAE